jgi:hypothetical protein
MVDDLRCRSCGMSGAMVPVRDEDVFKTHGKGPNARKLLVAAYRCLGCASIEAVRRDFDKKHEKKKPVTGEMSPGDGLRMTVDDYDDEGR